MKKEKVIHPLEVLKNSESKVLILGSFPSVKSREQNFFYMNKTNRFYQVLSSLFNEDFYNVSIEEKKELLLKHYIALYDVIKECEIINSSDSSISNVVPSNIKKIIKSTNIKTIFINGNKAYELFCKYNPSLISMSFKLPSTSSANAKMKLEDLINKWKIIKSFL